MKKLDGRRLQIKNVIENYRRVCKILFEIDKKFIFFIILVSIILGILPTVLLLITQKLINCLQSETFIMRQILFLVVLYIGFDVLITQITNIKDYYSSVFQMNVSLNLNLKILSKTDELDLQDFEDTESYNKIQRAQQQSDNQVYDYFIGLIDVIQLFIMLISSSIILFLWKWWSVVLIILVSFLNSYFMTKLSEKQYEILRKRTGDERKKWYYQYLLTNDIAFKEIKMYGLNKYFISKFEKIGCEFLGQDKNIAAQMAKLQIVMAFLEQLVIAFLFWIIIKSAYRHYIFIGDTITYIRCISSIRNNVSSLLSKIVQILKDTLYINQLFEFLDIKSKVNFQGEQTIDNIEKIEIKHLSYKYNKSERYVLNDINITINKNDNIALVGKNGSGKSTLIKILCGFYDDYEGEVYINNINLKNINKTSLRNTIGILFQDYNRYEFSVRENVGVGNLKYINDDERIRKSLMISKSNDTLVDNIDTQLGFWFNDGIQLSGGEWIRIAISRATMREATVYMLDEPNASLDPIVESQIFKILRGLMEDKIGIIVTHRISSIKLFANKIIVLENGTVDNFGTHEELMSRSKVYKSLFDKSLSLS